jgi:hypothetical protein
MRRRRTRFRYIAEYLERATAAKIVSTVVQSRQFQSMVRGNPWQRVTGQK